MRNEGDVFRAIPDRRHDLDWLRVITVGLVVVFHTARVFDVFEPFYVKNAQTNAPLSWGIVAFLDLWQMPLMFVLAGAATWLALGHRSARQYASERVKRLLVPLAFGLLVIVPPQAYIARIVRGRGVSVATFLTGYWHVRGNWSGYTGNFTPGHLWFILFLLVFSLVTAPLLCRWRDRPLHARWLLFAMPLVLVLADALPSPTDGAQNPWYALALFFAGFLLIPDARAQKVLDRARWPLVVAAAVCTGAAMLVWRFAPTDAWADASLPNVGFEILLASTTWLWILGLMAVGRRLLSRDSRALRYLREASYPTYVLHQTVLVIVASFVVGWNIGVWPKVVAILLGTLVLTLGTYEAAVRRTRATRFLFGLKPTGRAPARPAVTVPLAAEERSLSFDVDWPAAPVGRSSR
jgi:glucans biosynthesis protein C